MAISFSPPLGERVVVGVSPHSSTASLHFTAHFTSQQDYDEARRDGVRVELWTDIPIRHGEEDGYWRAMRFQEVPTAGPNPAEGFSLVGPKATSSPNVLHLQIPVPFSGRKEYRYTHRLVYPSGEIRWLGNYGYDGLLVLERGDPRFTGGTFLDSDVKDVTFSAGHKGWNQKEIARLSQNFGWSIHAIGEKGSSSIYSLSDNHLPTGVSEIFCVPSVRPESLVVPQTFSLAVSQGSSISVDSLGSIVVSGPAGCSLSLQNYDVDTEWSTRTTAIEESPSLGPGLGHAIVPSHDTALPTTVSVIPFAVAPLSSPQTVDLQLHKLAALAPPATSHISLFSRSKLTSRFLTVPLDAKSEEVVSLLVGPECGQFIIAPVYALSPDNGAWQISIVTPHTVVDADSAPLNRLPTPPPSPIIRPTRHRSQQASVPPAPHAAEETAEIEQQVDSQVDQPVEEAAQSSAVTTPSSATGNTGYISYAISLTIWLLKLWLLRVLLCLSARRLDANEDVDRYIEEEEDEEEDVDEGTVVGHGIELPIEEASSSSVGTPSISTAADVGIVADLDEHETPKQREFPLSSPSPFLFDVAAGDVSILLRSDVPALSVDCIKIDLDGKPVKRTVQALDNTTCLVEFGAGTAGGRISISAL